MAWQIKGSGTAEFRGEHSCRVEFHLVNTVTGETRRERKTMYVERKTKQEKNRCIREYRSELEANIDPQKRGVTFGEYAAEWIAQREANPDIRPRTLSRDKNRVRTINLTFGNTPLCEISRADIKRFQAAIMSADENGHAPTVSGRPLSGTTAHDTRQALRHILEEAMLDGLIPNNPTDGVKAPSYDTKEKEPLTPEQAARFRALIDAAEPRPTLAAFRLCLFAGLRRGEVLALRWSDFDADKGVVHVSRSLCAETLKFKEPKSAAGVRDVPLDAATVEYLERFKAIQARQLLALGKSVNNSLICCTPGCDYIHPENLTRALRDFSKAAGFPTLTPHILRHTYCTLLFHAGADVKTAQKLMGHADPSVTLKIYTHYVESSGEKAAAAVGAMIDALPESNVVEFNPKLTQWGVQKIAV